jgi:hypothetical protein
VGQGADLPENAVSITTVDGNGQKLSRRQQVCAAFRQRQDVASKWFWSLTMFNAEYFFMENPLNRYTFSQRNKFHLNPDGSVDLYLQHESHQREP